MYENWFTTLPYGQTSEYHSGDSAWQPYDNARRTIQPGQRLIYEFYNTAHFPGNCTVAPLKHCLPCFEVLLWDMFVRTSGNGMVKEHVSHR
jgi:hypothetical protein